MLQMRDLKRFKAVKSETDKNVADMMTKCYKPHEINKMLKLVNIRTNY